MQDGHSKSEPLTCKVVRIGGELAVVLPADEAARLDLREGASVEVRPVLAEDVAAVKKTMTHEEAMAVFEKYRGRMPAGYKFDRDEANEH